MTVSSILGGSNSLAAFFSSLLVLLRQESGILAVLRIGALQQGHLGRVLARAAMRRRRMVAIEFGM
jgi:hypothetical protein